MSTPVVVQGVAVPNPQSSQGGGDNIGTSNALQHDDKKETSCNDPIFAVLFYICFIGIIAAAVLNGEDALSSTDSNEYDYTGYITIGVIVLIISFIGAGLGMAAMMAVPQFLIKTSLIFVVVLAGVWAVMAFLGGNILGGILGSIFFLISMCYARAVWSRIPFATINLITSCTAIRKHISVAFYAYLFAAIAGGYSVAWTIAFVGTFSKTYDCNDVTNVCTNPSYGLLFVLFLAYFFGIQVFQNSIHVTVAGTVGTWWFEPDDASVDCCDSNVLNSFIRTMTTSFGSICFGSLLVAILQALRMLASSARENGDVPFLACIAECILGCLASLLEYFNMWAFVYVGLYGMPYMKAGKSVFELFRNRGWEAIIADDLVGNCLFMISLVVGLIMGGVGALIASQSDLVDNAGGNTTLISFLIGLVIGFAITNILMSTIGSAVNSVVVLFADAPSEFQQNHPELSEKMRQIWNEIYPGSI